MNTSLHSCAATRTHTHRTQENQADYTVKGTRVATKLFLLSRVSLGALAPGALQ